MHDQNSKRLQSEIASDRAAGARQAWQRPALNRMNTREAESMTMRTGANDGMTNSS